MSEPYANLDTFEGTASADLAITFSRRSRKIILTNDSGSVSLGFKFHADETYATLKPNESVSLDIWVTGMILNGSSEYRLWSFG